MFLFPFLQEKRLGKAQGAQKHRWGGRARNAKHLRNPRLAEIFWNCQTRLRPCRACISAKVVLEMRAPAAGDFKVRVADETRPQSKNVYL